MHRLRSLVLVGIVAISVGSVGSAVAADLAAPAEPVAPEVFEKRWSAAFGAYGWAAGLNGQIGVAGRGPFDVDLTFGDILEDLDIAVMAAGEVRYDRFGVFTDLFYSRVTSDTTGPRGFVETKLTTETLAATIMAEARVLEQGKSSLDAMAGARIWNVSGDLRISVRDRELERDGSETWVDPMIGAKARVQGDWPVYATAWGMVGGFGAGSEIDWDVLGAIGYEINDRISLLAGYRAVGVDYEDGGFVYDTILHGPVISGVIHF